MYLCIAPLSRFYYPDIQCFINAFIIIIIIITFRFCLLPSAISRLSVGVFGVCGKRPGCKKNRQVFYFMMMMAWRKVERENEA